MAQLFDWKEETKILARTFIADSICQTILKLSFFWNISATKTLHSPSNFTYVKSIGTSEINATYAM